MLSKMRWNGLSNQVEKIVEGVGYKSTKWQKKATFSCTKWQKIKKCSKKAQNHKKNVLLKTTKWQKKGAFTFNSLHFFFVLDLTLSSILFYSIQKAGPWGS